MARDINDRLTQLDRRRKGTDRLNFVANDSQFDVVQKSLLTEAYAKRTDKPYTKYALGAMQEVGPAYTQISLDTAERVGNQLKNNLAIPVSFRIQGSVRLNVHIRGVSDVDLLALDDRFLTYATNGCRAHTYSPSSLNSLSCLQELRGQSEKVLVAAYPKATVDCSGGKSIALSGGSLARPVDVVPSHWNDRVEYQASQQEHDRAVAILNKHVPETIINLPFLHIKLINDRDSAALGSVKKAIRLVKNVKNDAEHAVVASKLSSFDIAALMYHADQNALRLGGVYELAILAETQRFFDWCYYNKDQAKLFKTPDRTRFILNSEEKILALNTISVELDNLASEVAIEQALVGNVYSRNEVLQKSFIPDM
ncbi:MAG: hypothetical protein J7530_01285 [Novosphingobium sp.]|nr:hypothetical protein [Novosphingobium sp.]